MVSVTSIREIYEYNYWARDRQLEVCQELNETEFSRPMGNSFSSLHDTLVHLLFAEWIWLERFCGRSPRTLPSWRSQPQALPSIVQHWAVVEAGMRKYLAKIDHETLLRPLTYVNMEGKEWTYVVWQVLFHLAIFRRKNALSDVGRLASCAADMVLGGDFALVHSRARGEWTMPA